MRLEAYPDLFDLPETARDQGRTRGAGGARMLACVLVGCLCGLAAGLIALFTGLPLLAALGLFCAAGWCGLLVTAVGAAPND